MIYHKIDHPVWYRAVNNDRFKHFFKSEQLIIGFLWSTLMTENEMSIPENNNMQDYNVWLYLNHNLYSIRSTAIYVLFVTVKNANINYIDFYFKSTKRNFLHHHTCISSILNEIQETAISQKCFFTNIYTVVTMAVDYFENPLKNFGTYLLTECTIKRFRNVWYYENNCLVRKTWKRIL